MPDLSMVPDVYHGWVYSVVAPTTREMEILHFIVNEAYKGDADIDYDTVDDLMIVHMKIGPRHIQRCGLLLDYDEVWIALDMKEGS